MKLTKKQKKYGIGFLIIIGIILIFVFGFKPLSLAPPIISTSGEFLGQDNSKAIYKFSFSSDPINCLGDCSMVSSSSFDIMVNPTQSESSFPEFVDGLQENIDFETNQVSIYGIQAIADRCNGPTERSVEARLENIKAVCKISKGNLVNGLIRANINCRFLGDVIPTENGNQINAKICGLTGGKATIEFPKIGYNKIKVFRLEDNKCNEIQIFETERTANDYNTLEECQLYIESICTKDLDCSCASGSIPKCDNGKCTCIEKTNYLLIILFIGGLIGAVYLLIKIYLKNKKW